jgi:hypothetical protein
VLRGDYLVALRERRFRLLWLGQTTSAIGDALIQVALVFAVLDVSGAGGLGFVFAARMSAMILFILGGGVWADRLSRRAVMLAADVVRGATQVAVAVLVLTDGAALWHFVVAAFVTGAASAFFGPASTGLIPQTVPAGLVQQANALISLSRSSISIVGPVASGFLVVAFGAGWVFALDAATFLASAAFLSVLRVTQTPERVRQTFLADLADGWREVRARSWLSFGLVSAAFANIAIATYFVLGPLVVSEELGGARDWGIALAGAPVGALIAGLIALRIRPRRPLFLAFAIWAIPAVQLLALIPPLPALGLAVAAAVAVGAVELGNVLWNTVLQQRIPEHALSRVSAYDWAVSLLFMPLGYTLAPPLAEEIGVDATLALAAAIAAVGNLAALLVPSVRRMERLAGPAALAPSVG